MVVDFAAIAGGEYEELHESFPPESIGVWYLFDGLMLLAEEYDAFIVDLSGAGEIMFVTVDGDEAEVVADIAGIEDMVTLHMETSPKGSWRVFSVETGGEGRPSVEWPARG